MILLALSSEAKSKLVRYFLISKLAENLTNSLFADKGLNDATFATSKDNVSLSNLGLGSSIPDVSNLLSALGKGSSTPDVSSLLSALGKGSSTPNVSSLLSALGKSSSTPDVSNLVENTEKESPAPDASNLMENTEKESPASDINNLLTSLEKLSSDLSSISSQLPTPEKGNSTQSSD